MAVITTGVRYTNNVYLETAFDFDGGECGVKVIFKDDDGVEHTVTGYVEWES